MKELQLNTESVFQHLSCPGETSSTIPTLGAPWEDQGLLELVPPGIMKAPRENDKSENGRRLVLLALLLVSQPFSVDAQPAASPALRPPAAPALESVLDIGDPNSFVELPPDIFRGLTQATVECWVKCRSIQNSARFFNAGAPQHDIGINASERSLNFYFHDSAANSHSTAVPMMLELGDWSHVAGVMGPGGMQLYLNGVLVNSNSFAGSFAALGGRHQNRIGQSLVLDAPFDGQLDEFRVWGVPRNPEEIRTNVFRKLTGTEAGLVGLWNFDDPSQPGRDLSTNGHHGRLRGNARVVAEPRGSGPVLAPPLILSGTVTRPEGRPAAGARVVLRRNGREIESRTTGIAGDFKWVIPAARPGVYELVASLDDNAGAVTSLDFSQGGIQRRDLHLSRLPTLSGTVRGPDGAPLAGGMVQLLAEPSTGRDGAPLPRIEPDANPAVAAPTHSEPAAIALSNSRGQFQFRRVAPGRYRARVQTAGGFSEFAAGRLLELPFGAELTAIDFKLPSLPRVSARPVVANRVATFAAKSSVLRLPSRAFQELTEATVEGWVRWEEMDPQMMFFRFGAAGAGVAVDGVRSHSAAQFGIWHSDRGERSEIRYSQLLQGLGLIRSNTWCHLAAVTGPDGMRFYFNGILVGDNPFTDSFSARRPENPECLFGNAFLNGHYDGGRRQFDELRLWATARTGEQIRATMFQRLTGNEEGLAGLWNFDDGTARDSSPHAFDGELAGPTQIDEAALPADSTLERPAVLAFLMTDEQRRPLRGALATLSEGDATVEEVGHAATGVVLGSYRIGHPWTLNARSDDLSMRPQTITLEPGRRDFELVLKDLARLSGRVLALDDTPLPNVVVQAERADAGVTTIRPGLLGEYYRILNLADYATAAYEGLAMLTRTDPNLDFAAAYSSPFPGTEWHHLAARWTGALRISVPGKYTFQLHGDDGARLFIDGVVVTDSSRAADKRATGEVSLAAGDHDFKVEYFNSDHEVIVCRLRWSRDGGKTEIVPADAFFHRSRFPRQVVSSSNEQGEYRFRDLPPGRYKLRVQVPGEHLYLEEGRLFEVTRDSALGDLDFHIAPFKKGVWKTFTDRDGLVSSRVEDLCVAPDGAVWFACIGGVTRYDGREFRRYGMLDGLAHYYVNAIAAAPDGSIWIGTGGGLSRFKNGKFVNFTRKHGLPGNSVSAIQPAPDGSVWVATHNHFDLARLHGTRFVSITKTNGLFAPVNRMCLGRDGRVWLATDDGPGYFDGTNIVRATFGGKALPVSIGAIHQSAAGVSWLAATAGGVLRCDTNGVRLLSTPDGLLDDTVHGIDSDSDGAIWFSTSRGLSRYDGTSFVNYTRVDGMVGDDAGRVVIDGNGFIWSGSGDAGVSRLDPKSFATFTSADGLPSSSVHASAAAPDGTLWFGMGTSKKRLGGLARYDGRGFRSFSTADGLPDNSIHALLPTPEGDLWIGTSGGAARYDGNTFRVYKKRDGLVSSSVTDIARAADGAIWFASDGVGLSRFDGTRFVNVTGADGLKSLDILSISCDEDGAVWMANDKSGGVVRYDPSLPPGHTNRFTVFKEKEGLPSDVGLSVLRSTDGAHWFGTIAGVARYDGKTFRNFSRDRGEIGDDQVGSIFQDAEGLMWFATFGGVSCFDGEAWSWLDAYDGLPRNIVRTITQDHEGHLWFGTSEGLTRYRRVKTTPRAPSLIVQSDREYTDVAALPKLATGTRLTFKCNALDLRTRPENRQYRWQLVPHHAAAGEFRSSRDWSSPTRAAEFEWTTNRPGAYTLAVQYIDRDLNRSEAVLASITLALPWYRNAAIIGPVAAGNVALLAWAFVARLLYVRKRRETDKLRGEMYEQEHAARLALEAEMKRREQAEQSLSLIEEAQAERFHTNGTLRPDSPSYVERRADRDLFAGLARGEFCYVLTSRQMGKSSLMVRTTKRLRERGCRVATLDLTAIGTNLTPEQWYLGLLTRVGWQLDMEDALEDFWDAQAQVGPCQRFFRAIREVVLLKPEAISAETAPRTDSLITDSLITGRLVLFVDELDLVRSLPFPTEEFFSAIRELLNRRAEDAALNRLTFCLLGVATPSELIRDTRITPFNIGRRIELEDFTRAEAAPLARGLGRSPQVAGELMDRICHWTNGHPYLTQKLCQAVVSDASVQTAAALDERCNALFFTAKAFEADDNLIFVRERLLRNEVNLAELLGLYQRVHSGEPIRADDSSPLVAALRLSGIVREQDGLLQTRNRIYERVFNTDWLKRASAPVHTPGHEI